MVAGQADHLVFSEVVLTPSDGEYVEITNPTANDIDKFKINQTSQSNLKIDIFSKYLHLKDYIKKKTNYKNKNSNIKYTRRTVSEKLGGGLFSNDINKYVQIFKKINKNSCNIKIRSFGPNGFYISKK